ncbi:hypothetical protein [Mucilaginibacter phyllosphaerae]
MKYFYILLFLLVINLEPVAAKSIYTSQCADKARYGNIPDGRYNATVEYFNYSTYTRATYQLVVGVEYGNVVSIEFPKGGSVHSGYNNEGYNYTGGLLSKNTDYQGNIISYTASVTVTENNSNILTFKITIS